MCESGRLFIALGLFGRALVTVLRFVACVACRASGDTVFGHGDGMLECVACHFIKTWVVDALLTGLRVLALCCLRNTQRP